MNRQLLSFVGTVAVLLWLGPAARVTAATVGFKVSLSEPGASPTINPARPEGGAASAILVTCEGAATCTEVRLLSGDSELQGKALGNGRQFDLATLGPGERTFRVLYGARELTSFGMAVSAAAAPAAPPQKASLAELLLAAEDCQPSPSGAWSQVPYDRDANAAHFLVTPRGNVRVRPTGRLATIDEDDSVHVHIYVPPELGSRLKVERTSPTRALGELRIRGMEEQAARVAAGREECVLREFVLQDFAPGTAEVTISAMDDDGQSKAVGKITFAVARLYDGMFTLGAFASELKPSTYGLAPHGDDKIIVPGEQGDRDIRYAVFYTPFVWAKRDFEKGPRRWFERVNPTIGVTTKDIADHVLLGISVDVAGGLVLNGGVHFAHRTVLSKESGLEVGDVFTGEASEIPTAKEWQHEAFFGVSVDLRAMVALFKSAASASP